MNENYLMINGKRVDLTDEQIEKLGLKVERDYFKLSGKLYYSITETGQVESKPPYPVAIAHHKVANYCTDKALMQQRALHETLSRLLWRFSMQNDGDKIDKNATEDKYFIYYNNQTHTFNVCINNLYIVQGVIYFYTSDTAYRAIDEIVIPFMKEHPDFVW